MTACFWLCAALATEPPTPHLLEEKPHGRDEALISPRMWKHIAFQAAYQLFWLFLIVYGSTKCLSVYKVRLASKQRACAGKYMPHCLVRRFIGCTQPAAQCLICHFLWLCTQPAVSIENSSTAAGGCDAAARACDR